MTRTQRLTLFTAVFLALALLGALLYLKLRPGPNLNVQDGVGYEGQPTLGRPRAPVKLILFENFLCEHCKAFEADTFGRLEEAYIGTGQVEAYYVNLAWGETDAFNAGLAGECAYRQDAAAFWPYKTALFRAQGAEGETWATVDTLVRVAEEKAPELDAADLRACITDRRYESEVERDLELAEYVGVQGTPSIVVGDEGFQNPSFAALGAAIDSRLTEN